MLRELVARVADGQGLTRAETAAAMEQLISGDASLILGAALLTALKFKGETAEEITGFAEAMRRHAVRIQPQCPRLVDTCGTGGGIVPTFNISTTAAFVTAGAGVSVAKHGNRAITSACGSADVLEALGIPVDLDPARICACVEQVGIGFMFAQAHHPAMRHVGPIRRELPFRTVFNCLGPLTNPAGAASQVIGVYELRLVPLLAEAHQQLGCDHAMVVHGRDGLDELSTVGPTFVATVTPQGIAYRDLTPYEVGLHTVSWAAIAPGMNVQENAAILRSVLAGEPGPRREIVLLNAAAALVVAGAASDLLEGIACAAQSIDSGAAHEKLEALIAAANACPGVQ